MPQTRFTRWLDSALERIGRAMAWLWVALMLVIVLNVLMRHVLGQGPVAFEEIQWYLYSAGFLLGLSYSLVRDDRMPMDVLSVHYSLRTQAWIEFLGLLLFLLPFATVLVIYALAFVVNAYAFGELSYATGGLPLRWALKALIPLGFALLWLAAFSRMLRCAALLWGYPRPLSQK